MTVKKYRSQLVSFRNPFEGIYRLEFKSLDGKYKYHPGQFLHIAINPDFDGSGQWPESRCFSMQSNPDEETIKITYSVKGKFTKQMEQELKIGSIVWLKLPYGELFTQQHNKEKTVFIAGGTGITPFLSLFTHESFSRYRNPKIYLGFKSVQYNIYMDELKLIRSEDLRIFYEDKDGLLDINPVFLENGTDSSYFISGPPVMIKLFRQSLVSKGVSPSHVLTDEWE
jgi:NAD(P)H-flavin reductase